MWDNAIYKPELAECLVSFNEVMMILIVTSIVTVFTLHRHEVQQLVGNDGSYFAIERSSASGASILTLLVAILAQDVT